MLLMETFGQKTGPFQAKKDLVEMLRKEYDDPTLTICKLGISTYPYTPIKIDDQIIRVGKTGIYEAKDVHINSLIFLSNVNNSTIINFAIV